ncbi:MAG: type I glyceraldehyde-3-phosphate dehydrogenase [Nitrososphaerota archaeon]|jgi:glyceraldehyde 3-phosphate dehydrogenase|uniref:type I glyceraldehyde-3-phosphate dehydrogenase n=1 Tax=Candidatus Bathycorpusculum sp. TaxID=2994959 RepID=UPI002820816F|nr:type I glyceraldehyde-3-phosphate dehydrogenase [Candidatus Termiticorpusculum sp.]MCL2257236.1 type I glyceraldehyde-3-phosphate dehydrogenase [Candidatus Termiticorpusculum sp.]MCL2292634.1 type I glyceraldehyde-3-phosphate dehydrogenase [Candidatus Termiticorpusculum sp.]MDR0459982.1 type I glyceraldehyde-3-phosphate dehydrogenase [Nitrososphaerota archaeon]
MLMIKVGINGFGRIGRLLYRAALERNANIDFVAINDLADAKTSANLLKYDSVHGRFPGTVGVDGNDLIVNNKRLTVLAQRDPAQLPWKDLDVHLAVESTGLFTKRDGASKHLQAGAKKVLISAPAENPDATFVLGVNDAEYDDKKHHILSNASCTTNCLAPISKVLADNFGLEKALMTTCHSYTNDQRIQDLVHSDPRRARAGAFNIIPTSTGAAKAIGLVLPNCSGKMNGISLRVPTPDVSIVDLTAVLSRDVTREEINNTMKEAAESTLKGILQYTEDPIVSSDVLHSTYSAVFDSQLTMVLGEKSNFIKIFAWYDNEWGFSNRMVDLIEIVGKKTA